MNKPELSTIPQWYHGYVNQVQEVDLVSALEQHERSLKQTIEGIDPEKWSYSYAPGKWSIKELVQHVIDSERIFCYRALAFARKEQASLPGFDENNYAAASNANARTPGSLMEELGVVQNASVLLFKSFSEEALASSGLANNNRVSVTGIGFILIGHALHHRNILRDRYL
jgi:hypothetical protein